jgi:hypothetical protein
MVDWMPARRVATLAIVLALVALGACAAGGGSSNVNDPTKQL